jgi:cytochrome c peroxidase
MAQTGPMQRAQTMFKVLPAEPPALVDNPLSAAKIELGKMLFFDPRLSSSWLISCNTCHNVGLGGVDLLPTSIGHGWQRGPRNAPTVFNAVLNIAQFWDGRAADLKAQAKGPVQAAVEMNSSPGRTVETLSSIPEYVTLFGKAFSGGATPLTFDNMARAIEAFEATLLTPGARFDRFLGGDSAALNVQEKRGLTAFMDRGCVRCHGGANVGGAGYYPFGVVERPGAVILPPADKGRFAVSKTAADEYVFKAPSLRNVALTAPYFHSGGAWDLEQAVAVMGSAQLGAELNAEETRDIAAFLRTLTGVQPKIDYPILPPHTGKTPKPFAGTTPVVGNTDY